MTAVESLYRAENALAEQARAAAELLAGVGRTTLPAAMEELRVQANAAKIRLADALRTITEVLDDVAQFCDFASASVGRELATDPEPLPVPEPDETVVLPPEPDSPPAPPQPTVQREVVAKAIALLDSGKSPPLPPPIEGVFCQLEQSLQDGRNTAAPIAVPPSTNGRKQRRAKK